MMLMDSMRRLLILQIYNMSKKKVDTRLNSVFDVAGEVIDQFNEVKGSTYPSPAPLQSSGREKDTQDDYEFARENLHLLIEKGNTAIEGILELAREGEHPRSYEVVGQLIKVVSDITSELMKLQKQMNDITQESVSKSAPKTVNQTMFIGSTADLQKLVKDMKKNG